MESKSGKLDQLLLSVAELKQLVEKLDREVRQLESRYQTSGIDIYQLSPQFHTREEEQNFKRYKRLSDEGFIPNNFTKLLSGLKNIEENIQEHQDLLAQPDLEKKVAASISKLSQILYETQNLCTEVQSDYHKLNAKYLLSIGEQVEAASKAVQELDKAVIDGVKTVTTMGGVEEGSRQEPTPEQSKSRSREELAKRFFYEDENKIPPGVDPNQLNFLRDAAAVGAFEWVREYTAEMIATYFTTNITYAELAQRYKLTPQAVNERIIRGMDKMRRVLYRDRPELAEEDIYPLEQIKRGKERIEVLKSEQSRKRVSEGSRSTIKKPGTDVFTTKKGLY